MSKKIIALVLLVLPLLASCGVIKDPITGESAYGNLKDLLLNIFEEGPKNPWDPQNEFETTPEYLIRIERQKEQYEEDSKKYYSEVEKNVHYIISRITDLPEYNADMGYFSIPFTFSTASKNVLDETMGPDFRLLVPPNVVENIHLYNEEFFSEDNVWYRSELGALGITTLNASMNLQEAKSVRQAYQSSNIYLRIGIKFGFSASYEGFRYLPGRYEPFQEDKSGIDSEIVTLLKEQDLAYGKDKGKVVVKLVSVEIVSEEGASLYSWPEGLIPARTPTPSNLPLPTPTLPLFIEPTQSIVSTPEQEDDTGFCPEAIETRITVGDHARVTYGDPRLVRLRADAGLSGDVLDLLSLGQEFDVVGGPKCKDGFVWWEIKLDDYSGVWVAEGKDNNYHIEPLK